VAQAVIERCATPDEVLQLLKDVSKQMKVFLEDEKATPDQFMQWLKEFPSDHTFTKAGRSAPYFPKTSPARLSPTHATSPPPPSTTMLRSTSKTKRNHRTKLLSPLLRRKIARKECSLRSGHLPSLLFALALPMIGGFLLEHTPLLIQPMRSIARGWRWSVFA
jgi:hypothetical protein